MLSFAGLFVGWVVIPTTLWIALAVHYQRPRAWQRWCMSALPITVVGGSLAALPLFPWACAVWAITLCLAIAAWAWRRPRADRDWSVGMEVQPRAEVVGDTLHVRNFRNFSYPAAGPPIQQYEERTYDLSKLSSIDFFLSHWTGPWMAHTLASFGFDDGQFLCISIEARRQKWQSYSPLWGMLRAYELLFVLGDERDIVRVRTNIYGETVYMYRLRMPPEHLRRLLLDYVRRLESLATQPEWYNTITSNCTTNLFYHRRARTPWWLWPNILLNGLTPRAMYRLGYLDDRLPFAELQARAAIRERAVQAGDAADFSQQIRAQMPTPQARAVAVENAEQRT